MAKLIAHPENEEKSGCFKSFYEGLENPLRGRKSPYNPDFVEKIKHSEEGFKAGKYKAITTEAPWK